MIDDPNESAMSKVFKGIIQLFGIGIVVFIIAYAIKSRVIPALKVYVNTTTIPGATQGFIFSRWDLYWDVFMPALIGITLFSIFVYILISWFRNEGEQF